jgi:hypothetical protein
MLCFIDLIPLHDEVWDFFMGLLKILDIVMDSSINEADLLYLDAFTLYCTFFKVTLKPKKYIQYFCRKICLKHL